MDTFTIKIRVSFVRYFGGSSVPVYVKVRFIVYGIISVMRSSVNGLATSTHGPTSGLEVVVITVSVSSPLLAGNPARRTRRITATEFDDNDSIMLAISTSKC